MSERCIIKFEVPDCIVVNNINLRNVIRSEIKKHGYSKFDGELQQSRSFNTMSYIVLYHIGRRDILFQKFKSDWKPDWQKRREILLSPAYTKK